jgi:hypothetical protein
MHPRQDVSLDTASPPLGISRVVLAGPNRNKMDIVSHYPTTLGRVAAKTTLAIVGWGYSNASLSLYLSNLCGFLAAPSGWRHEN